MIQITLNGVKNLAKWLDATNKRSKNALITALRVEAYKRLLPKLREEIKKGAPGGVPFAPLSEIAALRRGRNGSRSPLKRLASVVRYRALTDEVHIGFINPGRGAPLSGSWRRIAQEQQAGFWHGMDDATRAALLRQLKFATDPQQARFLRLRKTTRRFHTPARPLLNLLSNFNAAVREMDLGFPPAILDDVAKVRRALDEGDWEKARRLGQHNEEYARAFKRISDRMAQLARLNQNALAALSPAPPVVVTTVPASGAADVDPSLTEIRITFCKSTRDYKLDLGKWRHAKFPDNIAPVKFVNDKRTCIIPVRLEAGEVYAIWITSQADRASLSGEDVAVSYLLIFETRK